LCINKIYRIPKDSAEKTEVVDITDIKKDDSLYLEYKEFIIIGSIEFSKPNGSNVEIVGLSFNDEELETLMNSATEKDFQSNLLNLIKNNPEYEFFDEDQKKFLDEYNNDFFLFSIVCYDDKYNSTGENTIFFNDKYDSPNSKLIDKKIDKKKIACLNLVQDDFLKFTLDEFIEDQFDIDEEKTKNIRFIDLKLIDFPPVDDEIKNRITDFINKKYKLDEKNIFKVEVEGGNANIELHYDDKCTFIKPGKVNLEFKTTDENLLVANKYKNTKTYNIISEGAGKTYNDDDVITNISHWLFYVINGKVPSVDNLDDLVKNIEVKDDTGTIIDIKTNNFIKNKKYTITFKSHFNNFTEEKISDAIDVKIKIIPCDNYKLNDEANSNRTISNVKNIQNLKNELNKILTPDKYKILVDNTEKTDNTEILSKDITYTIQLLEGENKAQSKNTPKQDDPKVNTQNNTNNQNSQNGDSNIETNNKRCNCCYKGNNNK